MLIYGNVFYRCSGGHGFGGVQIHGGKDNIVDNNLFVDCRTAISFSPWPEALEGVPPAAEVVQWLHRQVEIDQPPYSTRYPELAQFGRASQREPRLRRNVAVNCGPFMARDRGFEQTLENYVTGCDLPPPGTGANRFPLPADSPVLSRIAFRPIPLANIGLYDDGLRPGKE